jgi:hypothetical protein
VKDFIDATINYSGSSTNRELQACYKHCVREIPTEEQQHNSVQGNLDSFF